MWRTKLYMYHARSFYNWKDFLFNNKTFPFQWGKVIAEKVKLQLCWLLFFVMIVNYKQFNIMLRRTFVFNKKKNILNWFELLK